MQVIVLGQNIFDVALYRNCHNHAQKVEIVEKDYNCSDHTPSRLTVEVLCTENKPPLETFRSFVNPDFDEMCKMLRIKPFNLVCRTIVNQMSEELYQYFEDQIDLNVPCRTRHRQSLPPWITASTSHLMKRLQTLQQLLSTKPTSYRKRHAETLRVVVS